MSVLNNLKRILKRRHIKREIEDITGKDRIREYLLFSYDGLLVDTNTKIRNPEELSAKMINLFKALKSTLGASTFYMISIDTGYWYLIPFEDVVLALFTSRILSTEETTRIKEQLFKRIGLT